MNIDQKYKELLDKFTIKLGKIHSSEGNPDINCVNFVISNYDLKTYSSTFSAHKSNKLWLVNSFYQLKLDILYSMFNTAECYESVENLDEYYECFCQGMKISQAMKNYELCKEANDFFGNDRVYLQNCFQDY